MSSGDDQRGPVGPLMLDVTRVLRPPETRIGRIGKTITLPRTIPISQLVGGAVGALFGLLVGAIVLGTVQGMMQGAAVGAMLGLGAVTWSPLQGESLLTWIGLEVLSYQRRTLVINGQRVRAAIGICQLHRIAEGPFRLAPGSVEVDPDGYDERGALRSPTNRNTATVRSAELAARHT